MTELDGSALVYEKQGNTGAAAYLESDKTAPFAVVTKNIQKELERDYQKKENLENQKIKTNFELLKGLGDIKGWETDNQAYIYNEVNNLKIEASRLTQAGKDLSNLTDPEVMAFNEKKDKLSREAPLSTTQGKQIDIMKMDMFKNPNKYDVEESTKALKSYESMTPQERLNTPLESIFQPKYNKYALVPKPSLLANLTTTSGLGGVKVDPIKLQKHIDDMYDTEDGRAAYEIGVKKGDWQTPEEFKKINYDHAANMVKEKSNRIVTTQPKQNYDFTLSFDNEPEPLSIPIKKLNNAKTGYDNVGSKQVRQAIALGNIDYDLPAGTAFGDNDKKINSSLKIQSGNIGTSLYNPSTGGYVNGTLGDSITINGVKMTNEEALRKGLLKYKVIFQGTGKDDTGEEMPVFFNPDAIQKGVTNNSSAALKDMRDKYAKLNKFVDELNKKYQTNNATTTTTTNKKPSTGTSGTKTTTKKSTKVDPNDPL